MEKNNQKDPKKNDNFFNKNPLLVFAIFSIVTVILFKSMFEDGSIDGTGSTGGTTQAQNVSYYELKKLAETGKIEYVSIGESTIKATSKGEPKSTFVAKRVIPDDTLIPLLEKQNVKYGAYTEKNWLTDLVFGWVLPVFIFFAIWMFLTNRMQKNMGGGILGIGSMKKLMNSEKPKVKFADVAGNDEAKEEVQELIEFLKSPDKYMKLGAKIPKGVLLVGPPGTGKTLLAKAVAGEAEVPFFSVSGSSFIEMFVGVGASRVRDLFDQAKKEAPSIIFIDELDAIGKSRAMGGIGGNDEREQTLNQMLAEMDGFGAESPVIVLAATNRPEILDPALLRPGRFDRQVLVDKPDYKGRIEILKVHAKNVKLSEKADLEEIAKLTAGLAGADLANIINEAALLAGRESQESVDQENLKEAVERAIAGLEKKSRRISPKEKRIVAYHESGHAVVSQTTKGSKNVNKVSIIPRGLAALGYTLNTPEENKYLVQKHELIAEVDVLLGGRAAEELFIGEISTGAANDLERATDIIKSMIMYYGMSEVAGLMVLEKQRSTFLGGGMTQAKDYSEKMSEELDAYIKAKLAERYEAVKAKLNLYRGAMETMTAELLEIEVLEKDRVEDIIKSFEDANGITRDSDVDELHSPEKQ
jgi:cell division protease FtsH